MGKILIITEKPSVAREFARVLKYQMKNRDGYLESEEAIITWCIGHLVTMSYPDAYDPSLKRWTLDTLPFVPEIFKYEVIANVKKQFEIVKSLFNRPEVTTIYNAGDSGREGEYIQRLVLQMAGYNPGVSLKRIWIDSQTEEEIMRGIREAKDMSEYDHLSDAAYLRAKEDYLMGINFSRVLTLKYGDSIKNYLKNDKSVISVGRVMTCVLGMVVNREREIRSFVKTPFYRVIGSFGLKDKTFDAEWRAAEGTRYFASPLLYKENGFREEKDAQELIAALRQEPIPVPTVFAMEKKKEKKNPPLLYNLAELQNECSRFFKISPDETLRIVQELYEKKLVTYPRTDARVLSTAVAKEIQKNISGLKQDHLVGVLAEEVLNSKTWQKLASTRYVNDKQITDHYAIIPTGQGMGALASLTPVSRKVYEVIARRFLCIFYPPAVYQKISLTISMEQETHCEKFFSTFKVLVDEGYLKAAAFSFKKEKPEEKKPSDKKTDEVDEDTQDETKVDADFMEILGSLKKGTQLSCNALHIKEGETAPPKRYNSGTMILAMENAGQLLEDEELRAQIKGSGIGTSATRAEILKKLVHIQYLSLQKKTQIITPTLMGEMIYDVVAGSIKPLLDPALTASWEKGLTLVAEGSITSDEYMQKLDDFVSRRTNYVKQLRNQGLLKQQFDLAAENYGKKTQLTSDV